VARQFRRLPFQPYAPVRRQLLELLRGVNEHRRVAGVERVPVTAIRWKRWIVKPFGENSASDAERPARAMSGTSHGV
jgi:hypothetical protein